MKKVRYYFKDYLLQSITILILFASLSVIGLLVSDLFSSIYIYSSGYNNDFYYGEEVDDSYIKSINKDQYSLSVDIQSSFSDHTLVYSAYSSSNFQEGFGIMLSSRVFAKVDSSTFKVNDNSSSSFCYVSSNYFDDSKSFIKEDKSYPIIGTFDYYLSDSAKKTLENSGADNIYLAVVIDEKTNLLDDSSFSSSSKSLIVRPGNQAESHNLIKGSELNKQYSQGYTVFLPLIYSAVLVPTCLLLLAYAFILRQMSVFQIKEIFLRRMFGSSFSSSFFSLLRERLMVIIVPFLVNIIVFLPIYSFTSIHSSLTFWLLALCELIYVLLFELFFTHKDIKTVYKSERIGNGDD